MKCIMCGSYAINPGLHGREIEKDLDLCDVCYWRRKAGEDNFSKFFLSVIKKRSEINENKN